jgi:hypothetical protein
MPDINEVGFRRCEPWHLLLDIPECRLVAVLLPFTWILVLCSVPDARLAIGEDINVGLPEFVVVLVSVTVLVNVATT